MLDAFFPNADLAFGVLGTELWSPAGVGLGLEGAPAARPRAALAEFVGELTISSARLADDGRSRVRGARTGCSRPGCSTPAWGRTRRPRAT